MNPTVTTSFAIPYVALSFLIAVIGSFVALTAASRIKGVDGTLNQANVIAAGLALGGVGVWAMHFIGMLALQMDVGSSYSMTETLISLVAAIVATSLAFGFAAKAPERLGRLAGAGAMLGLSVVFMHYLGMFGMKFNGYIRWDYGIVVLSMVIAVVAAIAALWLAFNSPSLPRRAGAALVMGVAVCAMHYTGMAAAEFICTTENRNAIPQGPGYVSAFRLPTLVIITSTLLVLLISVDQIFQSMRARPRSTVDPRA